MAGFIF